MSHWPIAHLVYGPSMGHQLIVLVEGLSTHVTEDVLQFVVCEADVDVERLTALEGIRAMRAGPRWTVGHQGHTLAATWNTNPNSSAPHTAFSTFGGQFL